MAVEEPRTLAPGKLRAGFLKNAVERLTIRGALFAGFSLVFVLWLISGVDMARRLVEVETRSLGVTTRFTQAETLLSSVRLRVLGASILVRDAVVDTTPGAGEYYRRQLQERRTAIELALKQYSPVVESPEDRKTIESLRTEIELFWSTALPVVASYEIRTSAQAQAAIIEYLIPRREVILRISERIRDLNRAGFEEQQAQLRLLYSAMRWRVWVTSGLALLLSIGVAFHVTRHASRLEKHIQEQRVQSLQDARDLQQLSARLVGAQEEERRTIARELHDELGQALTAIKVELTVAERALGPPAVAEQSLNQVRAITDQALNTVRDLSQLLHPAMLDDLGLPATIGWYLDSFSKRTGIKTDLLQDHMEERLAAEIETCLYRIFQEAMTNVARHAEASSCRVYLQRLRTGVLMTVEDDGKGFQPDRGETGGLRSHLGLFGVQERVAALRGTFRLESTPGKGTRLTVELPALPRTKATDGAEAIVH